jgi:hypothetical protein
MPHHVSVSPTTRSRAARLAFGIAVALVLQSVSCTTSSDGGGSPDGGTCLPLDAGLPVVVPWLGLDAGPSGVPLGAYANAYFAAWCDGMSRCLPFDSYLVPTCVEQLMSYGAWTSPTECAPNDIGLGCEAMSFDFTNLVASVAAAGSGVAYDAQAAAACLATPWPVCSIFDEGVIPPPACNAVFTPLVPDGGACQYDFECVGSNCVLDGGPACAGTCGPPLTIGFGMGSRCAYDAGCGTDIGLTCDGLYCRGDAGVGASCADVGFFGCAPGLFCDTPGTCQPQIAQGGSCLYIPPGENTFLGADLVGRCQAGLLCEGEALLTDGGLRPGTCQPFARLGEACVELASDEVEHLSGCMAGGVCSCGVCVPPPTSGRCADEWTPCLPYVSACDYLDAGTCLPLSSFPTCWEGQQCASGYCDGLMCTPTPTEGQCSD